MTTYSDIVKDEVSGQPVANVSVYVYNLDKTLATITPTNPVVTDIYGAFSFTAADGLYRVSYVVGGKTVEKDYVIVGVGPSIPTDVVAALIPFQAQIASYLAGALAAEGLAIAAQVSAGAYASGAAANATRIYADTTTGLAGTTNGQYFYVQTAGGTALQLYKNVSGTATIQSYQAPGVAMLQAAALREIGLPAGLSAHIIVPDLGQAFKADTTAVAVAGDDVSTITPLGETAASAYAYNGGGTFRLDENGVGYVEMGAGVNSAQSLGTFNLTPNTYVAVALARDTDTTGSGFSIVANGGAQSINIGFTAGTSQAISFSARSGSFANLNSRYGAVPLKVPTVLDFFLEAGTSSSWTNNSVRDVPDPGALAAGIRKVANTWVGGDSYSGARWQLNLPTKGGLRFYGMVIVQGTLSLTDRRTINEWLMKRCCLSQLKANSYDIFAVLGDSIALGNGDQTTSTAVAHGQGIQYLDIGASIPLKDPMQGLWPDQFSASGSMWPAFASTWYSLKGAAACMVNCGLSSSGLWAGGDSPVYSGGWLGPNIMPVAARKVRYACADVRGRLRAAIAYIGTNDRLAGKTQAQLVAGYVALRDSCRTSFGVADLPLLLISADTAADGTETQFAVVRAAQVAAAANEGIYLVVTYQNWLASGHHATPTGNVHLDQFANNATGVLAATNAAAVLV